MQHALHLAFEVHGVQWASSLVYQVLNYMPCRVLPQRVTFVSCEGHTKYVLQDLHAELGIGTYFCHSLAMAPVLGSKAGSCCGCGSIRVAIGPERGVPSTDEPSIVVSRTPKSCYPIVRFTIMVACREDDIVSRRYGMMHVDKTASLLW